MMCRLAGSVSPAALAPRARRRYCDPGLACAGVAGRPFASLAYGAAGVAHFLFRDGSVGGGDESLAAAELWAARAERASAQPGGFRGAGAWPLVPVTSIYYREPGVWWVRALIAAARGDVALASSSSARFAAAVVPVAGAPADVIWGPAGLLLGCAQLVQSLADPVAAAPVLAAGERLARELAALAERQGALPGETALGYLGAAVGWCGVAQALLRWSQATDRPVGEHALMLLEQMIALRRPSGLWPVRAGSREVWRGWCNGSAGWAQLWTLAWQLTGEERLLGLAERCAQDAVVSDDGMAGLCCGCAGRGFAALALYRATGESRWIQAAKRMVSDAARALGAEDHPAHWLLRGELGVALLAAELENPACAGMPIYEPIGQSRSVDVVDRYGQYPARAAVE